MNNEYTIEYGEYDDRLLQKVVDLFTDTFYWTKKFSMEYLSVYNKNS